MRHISIGSVTVGNDLPLNLIAGPCALESKDHAREMCHALLEITTELGIGLVFKTSFDKANRTSLNSPRGLGMLEAIPILADLRSEYGCPILTDVHLPDQCAPVAEAVDILQIPAFLCRQTDLLIEAARTDRVVNVKKGQFLSPWEMMNVADKITSTGNHKVLLCERGTSFGYNTLISDMRSLPILASTGYPIVFDATHSVQQPGGQGHKSGGQREFVPVLARAAVSIGISMVFMETHGNPDSAPSDGPNMIPIKSLKSLLKTLMNIDKIAKQHPIKI